MKYSKLLVLGIVLIVLLFMTRSIFAATFVVDDLADVDNGSSYTAGDGTNTLRKCIRLANTTAGGDTINFSVSGTISPASMLPHITDDGTIIDASANWAGPWPAGQPGIIIDGSNAGNTNALSILEAKNCHIRGLFLKGFKKKDLGCVVIVGNSGQFNTIGGSEPGYRNIISDNDIGVYLYLSHNNTISGNYIGTDVTGTSILGNTLFGVFIYKGHSNTIGGTTPGQRNIISGNYDDGILITGLEAYGNKVSGNYIGTDITGTADLGNDDGIWLTYGANSNTIGGSTPGERNIISGNNNDALGIFQGNNNIISGNFIGTDVTGTVGLGNLSGVWIDGGAQSNIVGGTAPGERNIISSNDETGVSLVNVGTSNNRISGNYIGTDVTGTKDLGNFWNGVAILYFASSNIVGGTTEEERNIISGNDNRGVAIDISGTVNNKIIGNYIGTNVNGNAPLGNSLWGVGIWDGASSNIIGGPTPGERNVISGNIKGGVGVDDPGSDSNKILGNYIGTNAGGTGILEGQEIGVGFSGGVKSNIVGGPTPGERNIISGNEIGVGISGEGTNNNKVIGNYIGTDVSGTISLGNSMVGVGIADGSRGNIIGGTSPGQGNVISGNSGEAGVGIAFPGTDNNEITGNYIGTDANGTGNLGNKCDGVRIIGWARSNIIAENTIAFNELNGVKIENTDTDFNKITKNSIHSNDLKGIELFDGGNDEIPAPKITASELINNTLNVAGTGAGSGATVEVFEADSHNGEGMTYLGSLFAAGDGSFDGNLDVTGKGLSPDDPLVVTTTHTNNNTSEFSVELADDGCCTLKEGWNLISFSMNKCFYEGTAPDQLDCVESVNVQELGFNSLSEWFSSVISPDDACLMVIGVNGAMDMALPPVFHSLKYMTATSGYWVKIASGGANLCIKGVDFNIDCVINLIKGWNLIGYPSKIGYYDTTHPDLGDIQWIQVAMPVAAYVLKSISGKYSLVIGEYGAYDSALPPNFSSLHYIAPCQGFWVKMDTAGSLIYSQAGPPEE